MKNPEKEEKNRGAKSGLVNRRGERYNEIASIKLYHNKKESNGVFSVKKIWKICAVALAAAILTAFAGCSARTAATADEFEKQAKSAGFTVKTVTDDSSGAAKSLTATKDGSDVEADYHLFSTGDAAQNWYTEQKSSMTIGTGKNVVDSDAYSKFTLTNGEIRYVLVRMDKTVVLCKTVDVKQSSIDSLLKAIGY